MTQIQFVGISPADLVRELESSLIPRLKSELSQEFQPKEPLEYLSIPEVCSLLKVDASTLWRWRNKLLITAYSIEGKILFKRKEIDDLINKSALK